MRRGNQQYFYKTRRKERNPAWRPVTIPNIRPRPSHTDKARIGDRHGIAVVHDPSGMFKEGARFSREDFRVSLVLGIWPNGMRVRIGNSEQTRIVQGTKLV